MNVKVLLVFLVLILVPFARESEAYKGPLPNGRKKIQRKRDYEQQLAGRPLLAKAQKYSKRVFGQRDAE